MFKRLAMTLTTVAMLLVTGCVSPVPPPDPAAGPQGWSEDQRQIFYTTNQGSQLMPYRWFRALRQVNQDVPFAADQLQRYGYLPNPVSAYNQQGLPVGFSVDGTPDKGHVGMTCAACHTSQIDYQGKTLRIDGGRTNADFQTFLKDLTTAAVATRDQPERFGAFARAVLGEGYSPTQAQILRKEFAGWTNGYASFMAQSLPDNPWGPGRLDAFGMIFNRVAGLDLGLPANMRKADAPVRYPFLWNAARQDKTQWNGVAPNGLFTLALLRNTGEVFGVFAAFHPKPGPLPGRLRYDTSANFDGLQQLEETLTRLLPPAWPTHLFGTDNARKDRGAKHFADHCASCHGESPAPNIPNAWRTTVQDVGTDPLMAQRAGRIVQTGTMRNTTPSRLLVKPLPAQAKAGDVLASAIIGSLLQQARRDPPWSDRGVWRAVKLDFDDLADQSRDGQSVANLEQRLLRFDPANRATPPGAAYEARVLKGIWAVAPYLHNGSVPNLWELLQPVGKRSTSFMVGSREFDPKNVGFVTDRSPFKATFTVNPANGNGNGGHEYGATTLTDEQKWDLIEYLKSL